MGCGSSSEAAAAPAPAPPPVVPAPDPAPPAALAKVPSAGSDGGPASPEEKRVRAHSQRVRLAAMELRAEVEAQSAAEVARLQASAQISPEQEALAEQKLRDTEGALEALLLRIETQTEDPATPKVDLHIPALSPDDRDPAPAAGRAGEGPGTTGQAPAAAADAADTGSPPAQPRPAAPAEPGGTGGAPAPSGAGGGEDGEGEAAAAAGEGDEDGEEDREEEEEGGDQEPGTDYDQLDPDAVSSMSLVRLNKMLKKIDKDILQAAFDAAEDDDD